MVSISHKVSTLQCYAFIYTEKHFTFSPMALIHRSLFTWLAFLAFVTLVVLRFDQRIFWNWFFIFVPMWIYDFISIFYLIFYLLSHFRNGFCHEDLRLMFWKTWLLMCVFLKVVFQILLCLYMEQDGNWLSLRYVMQPAWVLMIALSLNLFAKIRILYYKS